VSGTNRLEVLTLLRRLHGSSLGEHLILGGSSGLQGLTILLRLAGPGEALP